MIVCSHIYIYIFNSSHPCNICHKLYILKLELLGAKHQRTRMIKYPRHKFQPSSLQYSLITLPSPFAVLSKTKKKRRRDTFTLYSRLNSNSPSFTSVYHVHQILPCTPKNIEIPVGSSTNVI